MTNKGVLRLAAPETITGNFTQTSAGMLDLELAGDAAGQYGSLSVTSLATLDGGLAIDLTNGFTLATGDSFDILGFGGLTFTSPTDDFRTLSFDGASCIDEGGGVWGCKNAGLVASGRDDRRGLSRHQRGRRRRERVCRRRECGCGLRGPRALDLGAARHRLPGSRAVGSEEALGRMTDGGIIELQ